MYAMQTPFSRRHDTARLDLSEPMSFLPTYTNGLLRSMFPISQVSVAPEWTIEVLKPSSPAADKMMLTALAARVIFTETQ